MQNFQGKSKDLLNFTRGAGPHTNSTYSIDDFNKNLITAKFYIKLDLDPNLIMSKFNISADQINHLMKSLIEQLKEYRDSNTIGLFNCTAGVMTNFITMSPRISLIPEFDLSDRTEKFTIDDAHQLVGKFVSNGLDQFIIPYEFNDLTVLVRSLPQFEIDIPTVKFSTWPVDTTIQNFINQNELRERSKKLKDIHNKINCNHLVLLNSQSIENGVLNLLKIKNLESIDPGGELSGTVPWLKIINEHIKDKNIAAAQTKLFKNGLKEFARC